MTRHIPDDVLLRFVEGDLDDDEAVEAALHIDACPHCAARAVQAEPLAEVFAALPDPELPVGFEERVLAQLEHPEAAMAPMRVPWLGIGMIMSAALLMVAGGEPTVVLWKFAAVARGLGVAVNLFLNHLPSPSAVLTIAALLTLGCSLTAVRLLGLSRESA